MITIAIVLAIVLVEGWCCYTVGHIVGFASGRVQGYRDAFAPKKTTRN